MIAPVTPATHDTSNSAFLSAASPKHIESSDHFSVTTVDQIAAIGMGRDTQVASLQLAMDLRYCAGRCGRRSIDVRTGFTPLHMIAGVRKPDSSDMSDPAAPAGWAAYRAGTLFGRL